MLSLITITYLKALCLEDEAGADLVGGLVELLGIERGTEAEGDTRAEEDVVGNSGDTTVVDLDLYDALEDVKDSKQESSYLGEGERVQAVLACNLEADLVAGLGVPGGLGAGLNLRVDLVVVRSGEDAQVAGSGDGSSVFRGSVSNGSGVVGDGGLLDVISSRGTSQEAVLSNDSINTGSWALQQVEEDAAVEVGLLEVQVELCALGLGGGQEGAEELSLEALGDGVVDLDLGVKSVDGVPGLGNSHACTTIEHG